MSEDKPLWLRQLEQFLGEEGAEEALRQLQERGINPEQLSAFSVNPEQMNAFARQALQLFNSEKGPVNWTAALEVATANLTRRGKNQPVSYEQSGKVKDALSVADLWLDSVTELLPGTVSKHAWNGGKWVQDSRPQWQALIDPVIEKVFDELFTAGESLLAQRGFSIEQVEAFSPFGSLGQGTEFRGLIRGVFAGFFGVQIGTRLGEVAMGALGAADVGLPLSKQPMMGLLPANVEEFEKESSLPSHEVLYYLAVREAAYARLFVSVPWLWHHLNLIISRYVDMLEINQEKIQEFMDGLIERAGEQFANGQNPFEQGESNEQNPTAISIPMNDLGSSLGVNLGLSEGDSLFDERLFKQENCSQIKAELEQLQTLLAVIEGWVEWVTLKACLPNLSHTMQLQEMMRRRRATNFQLEKIVKPIFGLSLPPKYALAAGKFWEQVECNWGALKRDRVWEHPSNLPNMKQLELPSRYFQTRLDEADEDSLDLELKALLDGSLGWAEGLEPGQDSEGDSKGA